MQEDAAYKVCSRRRISSAAATILLIAISTAARPGKPNLSNVTVLRDIEQVPVGHERRKPDLYLPKEAPMNGKRPLIAWVHGGAWLAGGKDGCPAVRFMNDGYAVASITARAEWPQNACEQNLLCDPFLCLTSAVPV